MHGNARSRAVTKCELSEDERRTIVHDSLNKHYRDLLDQPIPALGNRSPRAAVKTARSRTKVVDWLKARPNSTPNRAWRVSMSNKRI
jgi:hypothetical protein